MCTEGRYCSGLWLRKSVSCFSSCSACLFLSTRSDAQSRSLILSDIVWRIRKSWDYFREQAATVCCVHTKTRSIKEWVCIWCNNNMWFLSWSARVRIMALKASLCILLADWKLHKWSENRAKLTAMIYPCVTWKILTACLILFYGCLWGPLY